MSWPNGRNLYKTARWQRRRAAQLRGEMFCRMCLEQNRYNDGSLRADGSPQRNPRRCSLIADHVEPHRHDETRFWEGELQTLCADHHDLVKQREEVRGFSRRAGEDGWPSDPAHPANGLGRVFGFSIPHNLQPSRIPVVLVCGPPGAGQDMWVDERAGRSDTIIDFDRILKKVGGQPWTLNRSSERRAYAYRDRMLRGLAHAHARRAFLVVPAPSVQERAAWADALGSVDVVELAPPKECCLSALAAEAANAQERARQVRAVNAWFEGARRSD